MQDILHMILQCLEKLSGLPLSFTDINDETNKIPDDLFKITAELDP